MHAMIEFTRGVMAMPTPVRAWVMLLALTNMASIAFIGHLEAQVVLAALMLGGGIQAAINAKLGFVRLLGVGHFHWIPMQYWLYIRLDTIRPEPAFYYWIVALLAMNGISLVIDVIDVVRYALGDRQPTAPPA